MKKRRKKKKSRYKKGEYTSTKTGLVSKYRSGWECKFMEYLDINPDIISWAYEAIKIPYVSNQKTGKLRNYLPDFLVESASEGYKLIEIKPHKKVFQAKVVKKTLAAGDWCRKNNIKFSIITERELKSLGLL
jgi:hypothetical protein